MRSSQIDNIRQARKGSVKFINKEKNLFYPTLKKRVDKFFAVQERSRFGNTQLFLKTLALLLLYIFPFIILLAWTLGWIVSMILWGLMGMGLAGLGMSVMHDANHGAYSSSPVINWCMSHVLNLLGGSTINWKLQHNILHHTYTNITHMDDDISAKPGLRLSPHTPYHYTQRYQWWHAFILYGLTTLYWVTAKDFIQWMKYRRDKVNTSSLIQYRWMLVQLIVGKLLYFTIFMVVPTVIFSIPFIKVVSGFVLMHFLGGLIMTVIFQLAHSLEGTTHPLPDTAGIIENDWAIHQMNTTMNFSPDNTFLSWYVGGLNFQVEHHLFPKISHVHYPSIAPIVEATAAEFNIPYLQHKSFLSALRAHITFLKKLGRLPNIDEAIG